MFRFRLRAKCSVCCFPRVRGDVPWISCSLPASGVFSPRARGCSYGINHCSSFPIVFPACAGMFLFAAYPTWGLVRFPRVRGDVPGRIAKWLPLMAVFPACAGMFQVDFNDMLQDPEFSPRARGCSRLNCVQSKLSTVFPACAGMFLAETQLRGLRRGFPRVRGDVPMACRIAKSCTAFSPRARGCSCAACVRRAR